MREQTKLGLGVVEAALLLGLLGDVLLRAEPWGLNLSLWVAALVAAFVALARRRRVASNEDGRWLLPCALAFAAAFAWRDSATLKTLDALAVLVLLALSVLRARRGRIRLAGMTEYALAALASCVSAAFGPLILLFNDIKWKEIPRGGWTRNGAAVVRGIAIAAPLVLVFGALFVAADAIYAGLVRETFNFDGARTFSHVVLFACFAWLSAGFLRGAFVANEPKVKGYGLAARVALAGVWEGASWADEAGDAQVRERKEPEVKNVSAVPAEEGRAAAFVADEAPPRGEGTGAAETKAGNVSGAAKTEAGKNAMPLPPLSISLGIIEVAVVLGLLNALFFSFVVVQLRYFFGGAEVVMTSAGLTFAEYARRGFFELVWVTALALPLLLAAHWLLKKENPAHERIFRALAGVKLLLLFVIMASAIVRMRLYQSEYGQTELRLYTTAFMGWLAVVLVWFALTVLRGERRRFACGALVSALVIVGALHFVNPDSVIVRTNAALAGRGRVFDACYASTLSADAAPALVEVLPSLRAEERGVLADNLLARWAQGRGDWRTWNRSRAGAHGMVSEREEMLREMSRAPSKYACSREEW